MATLNNIIPLNINSADRINIADSTTNFTISLRKSLRNIAAVEVSNVVIPRTELDIDVNNDILSGAVIVNGVETVFSVQMIDGDYTATTLATAVAVALNANSTMLSFPMTWTVTYSLVTQKMSISATYALGAGVTWAVRLDFTALINTLGIGSASTTAQTYTAIAGATGLVIPCLRSPTIGRGLAYNITSARLTNSINTSYLRSLGKGFIISSANNEIKLNATVSTTEYTAVVPSPIGENSASAQMFLGLGGISMSSDGLILVAGAVSAEYSGAYVFTRTGPGSTWIPSPLAPVRAPTTGDGQGKAVAISGNGNTMAIGAENLNLNAGGVYVFNRVGSTWTQSATLTGGPGDQQGQGVSLSIDGSTLVAGGVGLGRIFELVAGVWIQQLQFIPAGAIGTITVRACSLSGSGDRLLIGSYTDNGGIGAIWIYDRVAGVWGIPVKIVPVTFPVIGNGGFGYSVSLSADGNYATVGAPNDNTTGATWVYRWNGATWDEQVKIVASTLSAPGTVGSTGGRVAVNGDGTTMVIGQVGDLGGVSQGQVSVYTRVGAVWSVQVADLVGDPVAGPNLQQQGSAVAISSAGNQIASAGPYAVTGIGKVWPFVRSGAIWSQDGVGLFGFAIPIVSRFGWYIGLSADASTLIAGQPLAYSGNGAAYVYTTNGLGWAQQAELLPIDAVDPAAFGISVALSGNGNIAAVGGDDDDAGLGAVWIFVRSSAGVWTQSAKLVRPLFTKQGRFIALNANGDTLIISSGIIGPIGVLVMNRVGTSTWVEKVFGLGSGSLGGGPAFSLGISDDGQTQVMSVRGGGAAIFTLVAGTWTQQGPNLDTLVTLVDGASVTFGTTCVISPNGNRIAIGSEQDGTAGCGATYIFNRVAGVWAQQGAGLVGTPNVPLNQQGSALAFFNAGASIAIGAPTAPATFGRVWIYDLLAGTWTQRGAGPLVGSITNGAYGIGLAGAGKKLAIGEPFGTNATGNLFVHSDSGATGSVALTVQVPAKSYTIFDMVSALGREMAGIVGVGSGYTASFDGLSTLTLASYIASPVTSSTFVVDPASTFTMARWPGTDYKSSQASSTMDFSINNDVLKTIVNHSDNSDNVIVDNSRDVQYRKYPAGYTVATDEIIDIQLRDDRDRIADLQGADWIMTIYATIRA